VTDNDGQVRVAATVSGQVQGVGFRWFVVRESRRLGLVGWVANAPDGTVRLEAQGPRRDIDALVALVHEGPPGARVDSVAVSSLEPFGSEDGFASRSLAHQGD
jgi:acylphosphatase